MKLAATIIDKAPHLVDIYGLEERFIKNPLMGDNIKRSIFGGGGFLPVFIFDIVIKQFIERSFHARNCICGC